MKKMFIIEGGPGASRKGETVPNFIVARTNTVSELMYNIFGNKVSVGNQSLLEGESTIYTKIISYNNQGVVYITEDLKKKLKDIMLEKSGNTLCIEVGDKSVAFVRDNSDGGKTNRIGYEVSLSHIPLADNQESFIDED